MMPTMESLKRDLGETVSRCNEMGVPIGHPDYETRFEFYSYYLDGDEEDEGNCEYSEFETDIEMMFDDFIDLVKSSIKNTNLGYVGVSITVISEDSDFVEKNEITLIDLDDLRKSAPVVVKRSALKKRKLVLVDSFSK